MSQTAALPTIEVDPKDLKIVLDMLGRAYSRGEMAENKKVFEELRETVDGALAFPLDSSTGFPFGWHGTGTQAIKYALEEISDNSEELFIRHWNMGDLSEWPEYYDWLKTQ